MRFSKFLNLLALLTVSLPAHAFEGGTSGGGGNTLHGHLIETYAGHSVRELPGYAAAITRLKALVPTFAIRQANGMAAKAIYLIPEAFGALPLRATELDFQTDLPCYQTPDEIFCNPEKLKAMSAEEQQQFFIHEAVQNARLAATSDAPSIGDLRIVVETLIRPNASDVDAAKILVARNFGTFVPGRYYQKALRLRVAIEKADLPLCHAGPSAWNNTNNGNPFFLVTGILEKKVELEYTEANDIFDLWKTEDVRKYADGKSSEMSGELDQMYYCDALEKKYHSR